MNRIIKTTLVLCLVAQWVHGQDCINENSNTPCCNGIIRTDPRPQHKSNTERPTFANNFDWRTYGDFNTYHPDGGYDFGAGIPYPVGNPFFKNLSYLKHINNFPAVPTSQAGDGVLDFHPEDGWELLHRNMGFELDETTLTPLNLNNRPGPYFILYNRYTGVLRVLANLDQIGAHQTIETRIDLVEGLSEIDGDTLKHTALFGHYGNTTQTLDQKSATTVARGTNYPELKGWWVADFTMAYDPCICNNQSKLTINFAAINTANVQMDGRLVATSVALDGSGTSPLINGEDFLLAVKKDGFDVEGGMQTYHNIDKLVNKYTAPPGLTDAQKFLLKAFGQVLKTTTGGFVDPIIDKKISAAASSVWDTATIKKLTGADQFKLKSGVGGMITDFLTSQVKPDEFKVPNVSFIEGELALTGTMVQQTDIESAEIVLRTPGSYKSNNDTVPWQQYPAYNEAMGVVSILEKPKVSQYFSLEATGSFNGPPFVNDYLIQYQLDSIKMKYNPAAEIDFDRSTIYAAYVIDIASGAPKIGDFYKNMGFQPTSGFRQYITDYFPLGCMTEVAATIHRRDSFTIDVGPRVPISVGTPKLRLLIDYYSKPNRYGKVNHTMQIITVDLDIDYKSYPNNDPNDVSSDNVRILPTFTEYPDIIEIGDTVFTQSDTIRAWSQIFVKGNVTTASGVEVVFIAPDIDISNISSFDPGLEFIAQSLLPCQNSSKLTEVSIAELKTFCNSNKYVANRSLHKREPFVEKDKQDERLPVLASKVYPNPSNGVFNVTVEDELNGDLNVEITDFTGKIIDSMKTKKHELSIDLSEQEQGIYFIRVYNHENSSTSKLVLVK